MADATTPTTTTQPTSWWDQYGSPITGIVGGALNAGNVQAASQNALSAQTQAAQQANIGLQQAYGVGSNLLSPYGTAGTNALTGMASTASNLAKPYSYQDFLNSGNYQAMQSATKNQNDATMGNATATGMYGSGNMANALQTNAQNNANTYFGAAQTADLNRNAAAENSYGSIASLGANADNVLSNNAYNTAIAQGNNLTNMGVYAAQAAQQGGSIYSNALSGLAGNLGTIMHNMGGSQTAAPSATTPAAVDATNPNAANANWNYDPSTGQYSYTGADPLNPNTSNPYYGNNLYA